MKSSIALLSLAAGALADGVTSAIAPKASAPAGCSGAYSGKFEVTVAVVKNKRDEPRKRGTCSSDGALLLTLANGVLTDDKGRTGYIASNYQFQFDGPPQAGAIYTAGFSVCGNDSLALGGSTQWWQCKSGDFYNLYDRNWAAQCEAVEIIAMSCDGNSPGASEGSDGQVVATQVVTTTIVKPISDGQPQVITTTIPVPICQIGDGQVQGHTTPCALIQATTTAQPNTGVPVSQFSDGQIQVTTPAGTKTGVPVSQHSDGQVQVTTPAATASTARSFKTSATKGNGTAASSGGVQTSSGGAPTSSPAPVTASGALRNSVGLGSFVALLTSMGAAYLLL